MHITRLPWKATSMPAKHALTLRRCTQVAWEHHGDELEIHVQSDSTAAEAKACIEQRVGVSADFRLVFNGQVGITPDRRSSSVLPPMYELLTPELLSVAACGLLSRARAQLALIMLSSLRTTLLQSASLCVVLQVLQSSKPLAHYGVGKEGSALLELVPFTPHTPSPADSLLQASHQLSSPEHALVSPAAMQATAAAPGCIRLCTPAFQRQLSGAI